MKLLVTTNATTWSDKDWDNNLESAHKNNHINDDEYNYFKSFDERTKVELICRAIDEIEDKIIDIINEAIYGEILLSAEVNNEN